MDDRDRAKDLFLKGVACLERRDFYSAERVLVETLRFAPRSVPTFNNLAIAQYEQGKTNDAALTAQKVLEIDPDNIDAYLTLSTCQKDQHRYDEVLKSCQKVISIDPTIAEAHCNLGYIVVLELLSNAFHDKTHHLLSRCSLQIAIFVKGKDGPAPLKGIRAHANAPR
jgi:tetratricopeptide (TPR) repeat protein